MGKETGCAGSEGGGLLIEWLAAASILGWDGPIQRKETKMELNQNSACTHPGASLYFAIFRR